MPKTPTQPSLPQPLTPFEMYMSDDALVSLDKLKPNGTQKFEDSGYMAVNPGTISGMALPSGLNGMFIHYVGSGVQANGSIQYKKLSYELVGYTGNAVFGHEDNTGMPTVSGTLSQVVLAQGDLLKGGQHQLAFGVDNQITGEVDVSVQIGHKTVGAMDIRISHDALSDLRPAPNGFTLDGGTLHATFVPLVA